MLQSEQSCQLIVDDMEFPVTARRFKHSCNTDGSRQSVSSGVVSAISRSEEQAATGPMKWLKETFHSSYPQQIMPQLEYASIILSDDARYHWARISVIPPLQLQVVKATQVWT